MHSNLVDILEDRRLAAGKNGTPLGYKAWGGRLGVVYTSLFRFAKGEGTLGIEAIRTLAQVGLSNGDTELLYGLAEYALAVQLPPVDN